MYIWVMIAFYLRRANYKYFLTLESAYESWRPRLYKLKKKVFFKRLHRRSWKIFEFFFQKCKILIFRFSPKYLSRTELPELDTCFDTRQGLQLDTRAKASVDTDTSDMATCVILLIRYAFQSDALILDLFVLISVWYLRTCTSNGFFLLVFVL